MPKRKLVRVSDFPYHISARCNNKEWFEIPMESVWRIFTSYLSLITLVFEVEIHAFVLMNNHFHLIVRTPLSNIDSVMQYFQRETSKMISREHDRINHIYGGSYHYSILNDVNHYNNVYKYVLRNPVAAGTAKQVEHYQFSSLRGLLGFERLPFPTFANHDLFDCTEEVLSWLNTPYEPSVNEAIRKGLRRSDFKISRDQKTGKIIALPETRLFAAAHP